MSVLRRKITNTRVKDFSISYATKTEESRCKTNYEAITQFHKDTRLLKCYHRS